MLTATDSLGHATNTYNATGNLTSTANALGQTVTFAVNAQGLATSMTDPRSNVTNEANLVITAFPDVPRLP